MGSRSPRRTNRDVSSPRSRRRKFTEEPKSRNNINDNKNNDKKKSPNAPREARHRNSNQATPLVKHHRERSHSPIPNKRGKMMDSKHDENNNSIGGKGRRYQRDHSDINKRSSPHRTDPTSGNAIFIRPFNQTEFSLDDRFSALTTSKNLVVDETISVEIERKISGREPFKIPKTLNPKAVFIPKKALENKKPLNTRIEFKLGNAGEVEPLNFRDIDSFERKGNDYRIPTGKANEKWGLMVRREGGDRRGRGDRMDHRLVVSRDAIPANRHGNSKKDQLPDFSRRPGKYVYESWKDRPDMIPKGRSYYEHDDRDREDDVSDPMPYNFNGRGFVRRGGAGIGRGWVSRTDFSQWKHDKFEELENDGNGRHQNT